MKHFACLVAALAAVTSSGAARAHDPTTNFLRVRFEDPGWGSTQYRAGYRLSIAITFRDPDTAFARNYPSYGEFNFAVLRDIDNCLDLFSEFDCSETVGCEDTEDGNVVCTVIDDILLFVRPDTDAPGLPDTTSYSFPSLPQGPVVEYDGVVRPLGPSTLRLDGIDYGHNDDLPGLVLLSNVGAGRVLERNVGTAGAVTGWLDVTPLQRRNLAGLMTDVSIELRNRPPILRPRSVIKTSLNVPPGLFARYRLVDRCVGGDPSDPICPSSDQQERIEGTTVNVSDSERPLLEIDPTSSDVAEVKLIAFVVDGTAPDFVTDCNADGRVNAADAVCMGYRVLSNQGRVAFTTIGNRLTRCGDAAPTGAGPWTVAGNEVPVDFDDNGVSTPAACPPGGPGASDRRVPPM